MRSILIFLLALSPVSFGQLNCTIEFIDKYSFEDISIDSSFSINKAKFDIDSNQNHIRLHKIRGDQLRVSSSQYEIYDEKVKRKELKNDTMIIWLIPNDSICKRRYEEIWLNKERNADTVEIKSINGIQSYVKSILNYLLENEGFCGEFLGSFANTYYFELNFLKEDNIWKFQHSERIRHNGYECDFLEENFKHLTEVLPVFSNQDEEDSRNAKMRFTLWINYY